MSFAFALLLSSLTAAPDAPLAEPPKPIVGLGENGFFLGAVESGFQLRLRGVIQADAHAYVDAPSGGPLDTFFIRRARPIIEGTVANLADFRLLPDFGQGKLVLYDAYLDLRVRPWLNLRAGKFKTPFGLERLQQELALLFIERGVPSNLAPDRDVGVSLHGTLGSRLVDYELAVLNGVPDNGSADFDADNHKDVVGRLFVRPFAASPLETWKSVGLGVAATAGAESGTLANTLLPTFVTGAQNPVFAYAPDAYAAGLHVRVAPQVSAYVGSFGLVAELITDAQAVKRAQQSATLHHHAWQVEGSYVLTGERASSDGLTPARPFNPTAGGWGAFELAARWGELDVDPLTFPVFADPNKSIQAMQAWALGGNAYFTRTVKLSVNFERTTFVASVDHPPENALLGRLQVSF
jgi:phosphate-selective porin OprO/OprP